MTLTTELPTSTLIGPALAWAVGLAEGLDMYIKSSQYLNGPGVFANLGGRPVRWSPETDWNQAGPLIESNQVFIDPPHDVHRSNMDPKTGTPKGVWQSYENWHATVSARVRTLPPKLGWGPGGVGRGEGPDCLTAVLRAIVRSHYGDTVSVPTELIQVALAAHRTYTTNPGESVMGIALRQLNHGPSWTEIRDLNADRFPDMGPHDYYPPRTVLVMPALAMSEGAKP